MMRRIVLFAAACLLLASCTKSGNDTPVFKKGQIVTISASADMGESTKVTGTDIGTEIKFKWEDGDKVLVKVGEASSEFAISSISADSTSADFVGTMPATGSSYDVLYPVPTGTDPLKTQTYKAGGIASGLMQFGAEGCTTASVTLKAKTAILQLNLYTTDYTSETQYDTVKLGDGFITNIQLTYNTPDGDTYDNLVIKPGVKLGYSDNDAKPFYIVVRAGLKYKKVDISAGGTTDKSGANLNGRTFEAGTCINMPAIMVYDVVSCLAAGTRITMADGSAKTVENIVEGDIVRTFDHEAGCISSAKVCLVYKGENPTTSLELTFASGKKLSIVGTHDLLLENTRKYVRINSGNVVSFVGKRFYNAETGAWDELVSYAKGASVDYYCIYSAKHLNCITEGLLTCPDDVDFLLNIYELDANLKADAAQLAADIAKYGLCDVARDFPDFAQYQSQMEDLGCKYVYIAIGKGLVPANYIETIKSYWTGK